MLLTQAVKKINENIKITSYFKKITNKIKYF